MNPLLRLPLIAGLGLLLPALALAQTVLVQLDFDNSGNRLEQTGSAPTTFSAYQGTVTFATGVAGGTAAVFNGSSSLRADSSPVTTAFTIAFWMKTTTDNGAGGGTQWFQGAGLVDGELGGDTTDWGVSQMGTKVAFGIGSTDRTIFSTSNINLGNWIHVAATWSTAGEMKLYIDGALETTYSAASLNPRSTANAFFIGQDLGGAAYTGALDQIPIYDSVLTDVQVAALHAGAVPEPSTYAAFAGLGALILALFGRSRCRRGLQGVFARKGSEIM